MVDGQLLAIIIVIVIAVVIVMSIVSGTAMHPTNGFFAKVAKVWSPPTWMVSLIWILLFASYIYVWYRAATTGVPNANGIFGIGLALMLIWVVSFMYAKNFGFAMFMLVVLFFYTLFQMIVMHRAGQIGILNNGFANTNTWAVVLLALIAFWFFLMGTVNAFVVSAGSVVDRLGNVVENVVESVRNVIT